MSRIAVVTGGNKGIGYAIAKQLAKAGGLDVVLTARDPKLGQDAVSKLKNEDGVSVAFHQLDITDPSSIDKFAGYMKSTYGGIDVLVNNAGMAFKGDAFDENVAKTTLKTNYHGTLDASLKLLPLVRDNGRVVNVSSTAGKLSIVGPELQKQFTDPNLTIDKLTELTNQFVSSVADNTYSEKGWPKTTYGTSKVAVTALTRVFAKDEQYIKRGILINACCPGWVRTDMAGPKAPLTPDEGAVTPVKLALLPKGDTRTGLFWKNGEPHEW